MIGLALGEGVTGGMLVFGEGVTGLGLLFWFLFCFVLFCLIFWVYFCVLAFVFCFLFFLFKIAKHFYGTLEQQDLH